MEVSTSTEDTLDLESKGLEFDLSVMMQRNLIVQYII